MSTMSTSIDQRNELANNYVESIQVGLCKKLKECGALVSGGSTFNIRFGREMDSNQDIDVFIHPSKVRQLIKFFKKSEWTFHLAPTLSTNKYFFLENKIVSLVTMHLETYDVRKSVDIVIVDPELSPQYVVCHFDLSCCMYVFDGERFFFASLPVLETLLDQNPPQVRVMKNYEKHIEKGTKKTMKRIEKYESRLKTLFPNYVEINFDTMEYGPQCENKEVSPLSKIYLKCQSWIGWKDRIEIMNEKNFKSNNREDWIMEYRNTVGILDTIEDIWPSIFLKHSESRQEEWGFFVLTQKDTFSTYLLFVLLQLIPPERWNTKNGFPSYEARTEMLEMYTWMSKERMDSKYKSSKIRLFESLMTFLSTGFLPVDIQSFQESVKKEMKVLRGKNTQLIKMTPECVSCLDREDTRRLVGRSASFHSFFLSPLVLPTWYSIPIIVGENSFTCRRRNEMCHVCNDDLILYHFKSPLQNKEPEVNQRLYTYDVLYTHSSEDWYWEGNTHKYIIKWPASYPHRRFCHFLSERGERSDSVFILPPCQWIVTDVSKEDTHGGTLTFVTIEPVELYLYHAPDVQPDLPLRHKEEFRTKYFDIFCDDEKVRYDELFFYMCKKIVMREKGRMIREEIVVLEKEINNQFHVSGSLTITLLPEFE